MKLYTLQSRSNAFLALKLNSSSLSRNIKWVNSVERGLGMDHPGAISIFLEIDKTLSKPFIFFN